jgi:hypothetical protein
MRRQNPFGFNTFPNKSSLSKPSRRQLPARRILTTFQKVLVAPFTVTANGGGVLAVAVTSDTVRSAPATDWASMAAVFQAFRVKRITVKFSQADDGVQANVVTGRFYAGTVFGGVNPNVAGDVLSAHNPRVYPINYTAVGELMQVHSYTAVPRASQTVDTNEWTPVATAITAENQFAACFTSSNVTINTPQFNGFSFFLVEFTY